MPQRFGAKRSENEEGYIEEWYQYGEVGSSQARQDFKDRSKNQRSPSPRSNRIQRKCHTEGMT